MISHHDRCTLLCELPGMFLVALLIENGRQVEHRRLARSTSRRARCCGCSGRPRLLWPLSRWVAGSRMLLPRSLPDPSETSRPRVPSRPPALAACAQVGSAAGLRLLPTHSTWHSQPPSSPRSSRARAAGTASSSRFRPCCMRWAPAAVAHPRRRSFGWLPRRVQAR